MNAFVLLVVALALSADNFAIAVAVSAARPVARTVRDVVRLPLIFGACSFVAPAFGWLVGSQVAGVFRGYAALVACAVLVIVGWRTLRSAWAPPGTLAFDASSLRGALMLGVVTSGDSLAVGFGLAMTDVRILPVSALIGAVTGAMSLLGMILGIPIGHALGNRSKIVAGLTLMAVGAHTLAAH
jgi:manganese efflux pump family protein